MNTRCCDNCFYSDDCGFHSVCENWTPSEDAEDLYIDEIIEAGREAFYAEWLAYAERAD